MRTIDELKKLMDKYQKDLEHTTSLLEELTEKDAPLRQMLQTDKNYFKHFISDLNALIQSEEKERRELLDRYTKYLLTQNTISLNPKTVDYDEMRKLVINRFLESENK